MGCDYTVIIAVRQRFGDNSSGLPGGRGAEDYPSEEEAPFVGAEKEFAFDCPQIDLTQVAVLQFNAAGITHGTNELRVNGVDVPGGISTSPYRGEYEGRPIYVWNVHSLLIEPNVLKERTNNLHVRSTPLVHGGFNRDDFIVDNMVVWFKTQQRPLGATIPTEVLTTHAGGIDEPSRPSSRG